jgi:hypothetical protein
MGDANATWEILLVPSEHGRHRRTTAKFSITSAADHTGVLATPPNRGTRGEKKRHHGVRGEIVAGDCTAHSTKTHSGSGVLPVPFLLTGFITNPHLPQFRHAPIRAFDIVEFMEECGLTALLDLPEESQEQKGREERSEYDEKAEQERCRCWSAATSPRGGSRGGGDGIGGGAGGWRNRR